METNYLIEEYIDILIGNGYEVNIKPHRLENNWLGVKVVGFKVSATKGGEVVAERIHRFLSEALAGVYDFVIDPNDDELAPTPTQEAQQ